MAHLKVYRDSQYQGGHLDVTGNIENLKEDNFNDVISSVYVESGTFTMYQDAEYDGWSVTVSEHGGPNGDGYYPEPSTFGDHNDEVSSIKLNSES
jgi:hypothetical protein